MKKFGGRYTTNETPGELTGKGVFPNHRRRLPGSSWCNRAQRNCLCRWCGAPRSSPTV